MRKPASANPGKLSESLYKRLNAYAATAGAACAGMLGAAQPAPARVVYTPAHVAFRPGTGYSLDVDHNGTTDFFFSDFVTFYGGDALLVNAFSMCIPSNSNCHTFDFNYVVAGGGFRYTAAALQFGSKIGSSRLFGRQFSSYVEFMAYAGPNSRYPRYGNFVNLKNRYLGLKFYSNGEVHYGWARFTVHVNPNNYEISALLSGYAYESTPNAPIHAGQTSGTADDPVFAPEPKDPDDSSTVRSELEPISQAIPQAPLGLLALGAPGLDIWRPRQRELTAK